MELVYFQGDGVLKKRTVKEISKAEYTLSVNSQKENALNLLNIKYTDILNTELDKIASSVERSTWAQQQMEATQYLNASKKDQATIVLPLIDALIISRGLNETRDTLCAKIMNNVTSAAGVTAKVLGDKKQESNSVSAEFDAMLLEYSDSFKTSKIEINDLVAILENTDKNYEINQAVLTYKDGVLNCTQFKVVEVLGINDCETPDEKVEFENAHVYFKSQDPCIYIEQIDKNKALSFNIDKVRFKV